MRTVISVKRLVALALLLGANLGLSSCNSLTSPLDQAIYNGGDGFGLKGYSRTIFSSNNF